MLTRQKIISLQAFEALHEEWNELLAHSAVNCLFLTWEWLFTWWVHLREDRGLEIITFRKQGRLVAIGPFAFCPSRPRRLLPFCTLEFLGTGYVGSDYLNVIIRQGMEQEVLPAMVDELHKRNIVVKLSHYEQSSPLITGMARQMVELGWKLEDRQVETCPYLTLNGYSWESYLSSLGRSHRTNFRRRYRKLMRQFTLELELVQYEDERSKTLKTLVGLHLQRWSHRGGSDALHTAGLVAFHEEFTRLALQKGWLRLFLLRLDGKAVAAFYCIHYDGKFYYYQSGFDADYSAFSVGLVGIGLIIRKAIEEGAGEFDFLHGKEPYKYLWANKERALDRSDLFLPYLSGTIYREAMKLREDVKRMVKH